MSKKLGFYTVTKEYMRYLKKFENKIMDNEGKKERRPYLGVIIKINENSYFAPLSSPKPKHLNLKKSVDFFAIDNGNLGGINLNNMIPVKEGFFKEKDIEKELDEKYKILLKKQLTWCNFEENKEKIIKKAEKLYSIITTQRENSKIWNRCCDFSMLEEKAKEYEKELNLIEATKEQEIPQEKPLEEVKEQKIPQEKPLEEVKEQEILQEKPLEEAPKENPWEKKLANDKAKGLSLDR